MKRTLIILSLLSLFPGVQSFAQKTGFKYDFYGFVRNDFFYSSRQSQTSEEGSFYLFPLDNNYDTEGNDLNARGSLNMYNMRTRLGLNVHGVNIGEAATSANVEVDFRGRGSSIGMLRVRHAYFLLDWGDHSLLMGQTWHPLYGNVSPEILDINSGAPYHPDDRAPQVRWRYTSDAIMLTATAAWQAQNKANGPAGSSSEYLTTGCIPELFVGVDYPGKYLTVGAGVEFQSLRMRNASTQGYKVNERLSTLSYEIHAKYKKDLFLVAAKSFITSNRTMINTLGGFGVYVNDVSTGEWGYSPIKYSHSWLNFAYGSKVRANILLGYAKNLGADKDVVTLRGTGTNIDMLYSGVAGISYNLPHWKIGLEYNTTTAHYGTPDLKARVQDTHSVTNHRLMLTTQFSF